MPCSLWPYGSNGSLYISTRTHIYQLRMKNGTEAHTCDLCCHCFSFSSLLFGSVWLEPNSIWTPIKKGSNRHRNSLNRTFSHLLPNVILSDNSSIMRWIYGWIEMTVHQYFSLSLSLSDKDRSHLYHLFVKFFFLFLSARTSFCFVHALKGFFSLSDSVNKHF